MIGLCELDELVNAEPLENLLILDCMNFAFRFKHRGKVDFAAEFINTIRSFAKSYSAKEVVLLADWKYSKYRRDISPDYKGGRVDKYKDQTPEEKAQAEAFFEGYERALELAKTQFPLLRFKYVEADDVAAYLVANLSPKFNHTWLISSDADWDLLLSDTVSRFSFVTRKEYTMDNFYEMHGCDNPEQYISVKVLQGDSGDSVLGIDNIGAKRAYVLVREFGTAMDIFEQMPIPGNQKFIANLNASEDLILLNYELMDLVSFAEVAIAFPDPNNLKTLEEFCVGY